MQIRSLGSGEGPTVIENGHLFDARPQPSWTDAFLRREGHHLLMAFEGTQGVGFVSGIEILHPDKGAEMLLYELGVDRAWRRRGIGRNLVLALLELALGTGCRGMWVPVDAGDERAIRTYRSAGGSTVNAAGIVTWELAP